ncbi:MAG: hypothetical protein KGS61_19170 [Verrucomicrobia bacterium]|nr:hypothetical protein [Verrucomicrobiota bacterium]
MNGQSSQWKAEPVAVISLNRWLAQVGVTSITGWRWRKRGWLETVNIAGRQYVTPEAIERFHRRAVAGEFAQTQKVPVGKEESR